MQLQVPDRNQTCGPIHSSEMQKKFNIYPYLFNAFI
jgi:hypothetical protein